MVVVVLTQLGRGGEAQHYQQHDAHSLDHAYLSCCSAEKCLLYRQPPRPAITATGGRGWERRLSITVISLSILKSITEGANIDKCTKKERFETEIWKKKCKQKLVLRLFHNISMLLKSVGLNRTFILLN